MKTPAWWLLCLACLPAAAAEPKTLVAWEFNTDGRSEGWSLSSSHLKDARVANGCLSGRVVDWGRESSDT